MICEILWVLFAFANILVEDNENLERIIVNTCFTVVNAMLCGILLWQKKETKLFIKTQKENQQKLLEAEKAMEESL